MKPNKVAIIGADWPEYEKYCPNWCGMMDGLSQLGIEHQLFSCRPQLDTETLIAYQPDLIIYGLIDMVRKHDTRLQIRQALPEAKIVMWYGDLRNEATGQIAADMSEIDAMFVSNDAQNQYYQNKWKVPQCHFLPLGSPVYQPEIRDRYALDFIFVGATITGKGFEDRCKMVWHLRDNGMKIIDAPAQRKPELRARILKDLPSLYRSAKISLDWSHFTDIQGYTSNRFWIITGSGGFALTKRWPGCTDFYPEGTRAYFDTPEEALELRDFYLKHPEEREKIRKAGHIHAQYHTYSNRLATMFSIVYGKASKN